MIQRNRRSIRLSDYDYRTNGAYFVTLCTHDRGCYFGHIQDTEMVLNSAGACVLEEWEQTARLRPTVSLDAFIVMPNHFHAVLVIDQPNHPVGAQRAAPTPGPTNSHAINVQSQSLGAIVRAFKSATTRAINRQRQTLGAPLWQRNYWERIIRTPSELDYIRAYIATNPARWHEDQLYKNE
jgi:putative transposase